MLRRRPFSTKGEDEDFRRSMVVAYKHMTECMPDNGIQVIMFTHQSDSIWADMANIVWASGLQVTAAWYVVTETESALRQGSNVKGTVLLVLRKRMGLHKTTRDDLAWEIREEVQEQVADYYSDMTRRELAVELAGYLAKRREALRPDEASAARVLRELVKNQRLG